MITEKRIQNVISYMEQLRDAIESGNKVSARRLQRACNLNSRINIALINAKLLEVEGKTSGAKYTVHFPKEIHPITARSVLLELVKVEQEYRDINQKPRIKKEDIVETKAEQRYKKRVKKLQDQIKELKKPKMTLYNKAERFVRKYFWITLFNISIFLLGLAIGLLI